MWSTAAFRRTWTRTPDEIEEERRLLYVAMTRAKDELDLIVPQRFYTLYQQSKLGDRHLYGVAQPTLRLTYAASGPPVEKAAVVEAAARSLP